MADPSDVSNAIRGHKAAISNPHVSDEAKEHSKQVLKDLEGQNSTGSGGKQQQQSAGSSEGSHGQSQSTDGKDPGNVARGLKASINNPNVSEEAKEAAKEKLEKLGQ